MTVSTKFGFTSFTRSLALNCSFELISTKKARFMISNEIDKNI